MINDVIKNTEDKMLKASEVLRKEYAGMRAGRANPSILEKVMVDYYGSITPVSQMANISSPEARLIVIQPWDKTSIPSIEKAILKSDIGLTPSSDGIVIRLAIPQLTQERRVELVKVAKKKAEDARVAVRNIRRDANDEIKKLEKADHFSEDDGKRAQDEVQKVTDKYIKLVDDILYKKEEEVMEV